MPLEPGLPPGTQCKRVIGSNAGRSKVRHTGETPTCTCNHCQSAYLPFASAQLWADPETTWRPAPSLRAKFSPSIRWLDLPWVFFSEVNNANFAADYWNFQGLQPVLTESNGFLGSCLIVRHGEGRREKKRRTNRQDVQTWRKESAGEDSEQGASKAMQDIRGQRQRSQETRGKRKVKNNRDMRGKMEHKGEDKGKKVIKKDIKHPVGFIRNRTRHQASINLTKISGLTRNQSF